MLSSLMSRTTEICSRVKISSTSEYLEEQEMQVRLRSEVPVDFEVVKVGSESAIAATVSPVIRIQQWYETRRVKHVIM